VLPTYQSTHENMRARMNLEGWHDGLTERPAFEKIVMLPFS
jgi:hypothetical protein